MALRPAHLRVEKDADGPADGVGRRDGAQIEVRLGEIQRSLAAIHATVVDPGLAAEALTLFDPVWEALVPRERVSLLQLLIERIDYDPKEVAITFRPAGLASLGAEQRSAA